MIKMIKFFKSTWILIVGALSGGIASAYIGTNVSLGFGLLFMFLLLSAVSMVVIYLLKKVIKSIYKVIKRKILSYKTLKEKARLYDEHIEIEKKSIRRLGPPYTNGVMSLSEEQRKIIIHDLNRYKNEFKPSVDQPNITVHWLVSRYNTEYPEFPINGDTANYLLDYKPKDADQLKREYELDLHVYQKIRETLIHKSMIDLLNELDIGRQGFPFDHIRMLVKFYELMRNPEYKFMDKELEEVRVKLVTNLKVLDNILAEHCESRSGGEQYYIPRSMHNNDHLLVIEKIDDAVSNAWEVYELFIEIGKRKFGMEYSKVGQALR